MAYQDRYQLLYARLTANADVVTLLGDRFYPVLAPQGTPPPYLVWRTGATLPIGARDHPADTMTYTVLLTTYSQTADKTREVGLAVRRSLDGWVDLKQGVQPVSFQGEADGWEEEIELFFLTQTFSLTLGNQI